MYYLLAEEDIIREATADKKQILHNKRTTSCGMSRCVAWVHLRQGTIEDNRQDKEADDKYLYTIKLRDRDENG